MHRAALAGLALVALAASGCGNDVTGPKSLYVLDALSPTSFEATVGTAVQHAPAVIVKDRAGRPVANATVEFRFHEPLGESASLVRYLEVVTDEQGLASAGEWILGTVTGPHLVQAATSGATSVWFTANAVADVPAALLLVDDNYAQIGLPGMEVQPPRVRVADRFGNNVSGVRVSFAISAGGGSLEGGNAVTDASGAAPASWTLGASLGANTVTAQVLDLPVVELTVEAVEASAIYDLTMIGGEAPGERGVESGFIALTADGRFVSYMSFYLEHGLWIESESGTYVMDGSRLLLRARFGGVEVGSIDQGTLMIDRYVDYQYDDEGRLLTWQYSLRH